MGVSICLKERVRPSHHLQKEESFYRFQSSILWSFLSLLVGNSRHLPNDKMVLFGSNPTDFKVVEHLLFRAIFGSFGTPGCRQEVCRENQGSKPEHGVEHPEPLEPDEVARIGDFRHEDLPLRRYRRQSHQEAVQIRRQGEEVKETRSWNSLRGASRFTYRRIPICIPAHPDLYIGASRFTYRRIPIYISAPLLHSLKSSNIHFHSIIH